MSTPKSDISIPILTQIIAPSAANAANTPGKKEGRVTSSAAGIPGTFDLGSSASLGASASSVGAADASSLPLADSDWKGLELKLNERVLRQILRRIDFVVEHRVKESLADALQVTTDDLIKEIRRGLHTTLEDVIKRAVAQEIARVQSVKE